ncbi:hypothetical protein OXX69_003394 [Metschnikowia pulcherrima]
MAKLAAAPHGFGEKTTGTSQSQHKDTTQKTQTFESKSASTGSSPVRAHSDSIEEIIPGCSKLCETKKHELETENAELYHTIRQLTRVIREHEDQIDVLKEENERLQIAVDSAHEKTVDFDKHVAEIESAVTKGLSHTISALKGIRHERVLQSTPRIEYSVPDSSNSRRLISEKRYSHRNLDHFPPKKPLAIAASASAEFPSLFLHEDSIKPTSETKTIEENDREVGDHEEIANNDFSATARNDSYDIKVKDEPGVDLPHKHHPGSFDSVTSSTSKKRGGDDFDDITFFVKPPRFGKHSSRSHDTLSKALSVKRKPSYASVKKEAFDENSKIQVKRERSDEKSHMFVKQEPEPKRKALAPVSSNSNARTIKTSKTNKTKELDHTFDFVDKSILLEQSRSSMRTAPK